MSAAQFYDQNGELRIDGSLVGAAVLLASKHLTVTEVLAINTSPVEIVAAPGSGKVLFPLGLILSMRFVSQPYDQAHELWIGDPGGEGANIFVGILSATEDWIAMGWGGGETGLARAQFEDAPLVLSQFAENPISGDSPVDATVIYATVDVP